MKVKKFVAPSMPEAMKLVKNELGQDAVILNSKVVQKGGIFGFFTKKNIEVIAAVDPQPTKPKSNIHQKVPTTKSADTTKKENNLSSKSEQELMKEIKELKLIMNNMSSSQHGKQYPDILQPFYEQLMEQEIERNICEDMMSEIMEKWYLNKASASIEDVKQWIIEHISNQISDFNFGGLDFSKQFINVVGPTGVGKTTTLAKMAALSVLQHHKKVAFITTDTYRIAAIEQLKTYAKILEVPVEVAYSLEDFINAKEKFKSYDLILIDTAGRNYRNQQYVNDLKTVIDFDNEMETLLVLSIASKFSDMKTIVEQFSLIHIDKFIFTKVDETSKYGAMINLILKYKKGVAYLTNGQNVPDDIKEATPNLIAKTILEVK